MHMKRAFLTGFATVAAVLAASQAMAQIYKSTRPDGSIVYSDKPPPDAVKTDTVDESRVIVEGATSKAVRGRLPGQGGGPNPERAKAQSEVKSAEEALAKAKKAQQDGSAPTEGERTGNVTKKGVAQRSRLNDSYEDRQKSLQDAVTAAQKKLDDAKAGLDKIKD